jgi:AMMECR1 domain-containing protein
LSAPTIAPARSEQELLGQLQPGVDGLVIASGRRQATFLPTVWEALPAPSDFLAHLLAKAGISRSNWPSSMRAWRYRTIEISSRPASQRDVGI